VQATNAPIIGKTKELIAGVQGVQSLAQGVLCALTAHCTGRQCRHNMPANLDTSVHVWHGYQAVRLH
jgi:hypothetical protein